MTMKRKMILLVLIASNVQMVAAAGAAAKLRDLSSRTRMSEIRMKGQNSLNISAGAINIALVTDTRGIAIPGDSASAFGLWSLVILVKIAMITFFDDSAPLASLTTVPKTKRGFLKANLLFGDECAMDVFVTADQNNCSAPHAMRALSQIIQGKLAAGATFTPPVAVLGGRTNPVDMSKLASSFDMPMMVFDGALELSNVHFPYSMRTFGSDAVSYNATAGILLFYKFTRVDLHSCDVQATRSKVGAFSVFLLGASIENKVHYYPPSSDVGVPIGWLAPLDAMNAKKQQMWDSIARDAISYNAHAHISFTSGDCAQFDQLYSMADKGLVGRGHMWFGPPAATLQAYDAYLPAFRGGVVRRGYEQKIRVATGKPQFKFPAHSWTKYNPYDGCFALASFTKAAASVDKLHQYLATFAPHIDTVFEPFYRNKSRWVKDGLGNKDETKFWGVGTFQYYVFDNMWAILLAINELTLVKGTSFTSKEMLATMRKLKFQGITGPVSYDEKGDRIMNITVVQYRTPNTTAGTFWAFPEKMDWSLNVQNRKVCDSKSCTKYMFSPKADHVNVAGVIVGKLIWRKKRFFYALAPDPPPAENLACPVGQMYVIQHGICKLCTAGTFTSKMGQASCESCFQGSYAKSIGQSSCIPCTMGRYQGDRGQTDCINCKAGWFTDQVLQKKCRHCGVGEYAGVAATKCTVCSEGTYQNIPKQSACNSCSDDWVAGSTGPRAAANMTECVCPAGTYWRPGVACQPCLEGMVCPRGKAWPTQKQMYFIEVLDDRSRDTRVFECISAKWCAEGKRGSCGGTRFGRNCGRIENGSCDMWLWPVIPCIVVLGCFIAYMVSRKQIYGKVSPTIMLAGNISICIVAMQSVSVYVQIFDELPVELETIYKFVNVFTFSLGALVPECNIGQSLEARLSMSIAPPLVIVASFLFLMVVTTILNKIVPSKVDAMVANPTINICGTILQVMYVMQCKDTFAFFVRKDGPSGVEVLQEFSDIVYASSTHYGVKPWLIFFYLFFMYVVGLYTCLVWVVMRARTDIKNKGFREKFRFVLGRWRPSCFYWGPFMLGRNLIIALVPIVVRDTVFRALLFGMVIILHALGEVSYMPWMSNVNTFFEVWISFLLMGISYAGLAFHKDAQESERQTAAYMMYTLGACIWGSFLFAVALMMVHNTPKKLRVRRERRCKLGDEMIEKCMGITETIMKGSASGKTKWHDALKASSDFDQFMFIEVLKFISEFESNSPLRKRWFTSSIISSSGVSDVSEEISPDEIANTPGLDEEGKGKPSDPPLLDGSAEAS